MRFEGETALHGLDGEARKFHGEGRAPKSLYGPGASARVVIEAASIKTGNFLRDAVMRKSTLEAEKYPEVVFQVDGLAPEGNPPPPPGPMRLILSGRLSLHGVTKEKRFPITVERREEGFVVSGKFSLKLSEHRIPDPSLFFNKVRDEVAAEFRFTAVAVPEK
ncbi:MAG: YceI family protein [Candidatus Tectomicrobia bacterium]|nr:YceI family protein [Candidatus Tectomicrobia bacterium]